MKNLILLFVINLSIGVLTHGNTITEVGSNSISENSLKYVWAKNGLNLREAPSTVSKILNYIPFGDSLTLISLTDNKFVSTLIQNGGTEKHPILLSSNWVKVKYKNTIGFVIDGYLLDIKTPKKDESPDNYLRRISHKYGYTKLDKAFNYLQGKLIFNTHQIKFDEHRFISFDLTKKEVNAESNEVGMIWYFKGFSINEIFLIMNPFFDIEGNKENNFKVHKNWKEEIFIYNGIDEIRLNRLNKDEIIFYFTSSC